jgi:hypothetical protein
MKRIDITGQVFGRLTVIRFNRNEKTGGSSWICRCNCGVERSFYSINLRRGMTTSCGCAHAEIVTTHGASQKRGPLAGTYSSWRSMRARCNDKSHRAFIEYGGRGITICDKWKDFSQFAKDMGPRPRGKTLDRIENDKGYFKGNCRWVTRLSQARNRQNTRWIEIDGQRKALSEWCAIYGQTWYRVHYRLKHGWSIEKALKTPSQKRAKAQRKSK